MPQSYLSKASYTPVPVLSAPTISFRPALSVESLVGPSADMDGVTMESVAVHFPPKPAEPWQDAAMDNFVEKLTMFKCKVCGFLSSSSEGVELHLFDDHDERISQFRFKDENSWIKVAQREEIKLHCPLCSNLFSSERSFQVHLTEDHLLSESEAIARFAKENGERKRKTLKIIREEKEKLKLERRKSRQFGYEAYLDSCGELRIRSAGSRFQLHREQDDDEIDVEGDETEQTTDRFDMKASEYVDMVLKGKPVSDRLVEEDEDGRERRTERTVRTKVGRPKGSRTLGLSAVKKVNPNLCISDQLMGEECNIDNCAVRLKVPTGYIIN